VSREGVYGADPLTEAMSRLLALPLRELYAVLWRIGVVKIVDRSPETFEESLVSSRGATAAAVVATAAVESA